MQLQQKYMNLFKTYKTFDQILPDFLEEKKIVLKNKTFVGYVGRMRIFSCWLKEHSLSNTPINKLSNVDIAQFFSYLANHKKLDRPTCQKYFVTIRSLYQYAEKRNEVKYMPFNLVVFPFKKADMSPEYIPKETLKKLILDIKETHPQLYLACMILYYCFIRPGVELRLLKIGDFNFEVGVIHVRQENAKTKKARTVTMPIDLIKICKEFGIDKVDKDLYVFGKKNKFNTSPININSLRVAFNQYRDKYKLSKGIKFYSLKHTGATNLANSKEVSIVAIQNQLGHDRLTSTEHYIKKRAGAVSLQIRDNFPNPIFS